MAGTGGATTGAGGAAYAWGGAPYTAAELPSEGGGLADSEAPINALCASNWARSSASDRGRFSTLGRFVGGWEMEPGLRPSSISLRRL